MQRKGTKKKKKDYLEKEVNKISIHFFLQINMQ